MPLRLLLGLAAVVAISSSLPLTAPGLIRVGTLDVSASDVEVVGELAYLAGSGLRIIDVSNPAAPVELGALDTPGSASGIEVVGGRAYLTDVSGLRIIDVSNPAAPVELGAFATPGLAFDVEVVGELAYLTDVSGLRIIDVSNPATPAELGTFATPGFARQGPLVMNSTSSP